MLKMDVWMVQSLPNMPLYPAPRYICMVDDLKDPILHDS
jgi:hypothetical protein